MNPFDIMSKIVSAEDAQRIIEALSDKGYLIVHTGETRTWQEDH